MLRTNAHISESRYGAPILEKLVRYGPPACNPPQLITVGPGPPKFVMGLDLGHPPRHEWAPVVSDGFYVCGVRRREVHSDSISMGPGSPGGIVVEAAPAIVFGMGDEAAFDRIAMDVLEFFYELLWTRYIEVVVAALPELFLVG